MKKRQFSRIKNSRYNKSVSDVTLIGLFTAVIVISSWMSVPFPIPLTMQTVGIFLSACCLGAYKGSAAVLAYLVLGVVGVPVFSGFSGGASHLFGMTGGYLLGFLPSVFVCGLLMKGKFIKENLKKSRKYAFGVMLLGVFICYIFGACYYAAVYVNASFFEGIAVSIMTCVVPYLIPDMVKILITVFLWDKLRRVIKEV